MCCSGSISTVEIKGMQLAQCIGPLRLCNSVNPITKMHWTLSCKLQWNGVTTVQQSQTLQQSHAHSPCAELRSTAKAEPHIMLESITSHWLEHTEPQQCKIHSLRCCQNHCAFVGVRLMQGLVLQKELMTRCITSYIQHLVCNKPCRLSCSVMSGAHVVSLLHSLQYIQMQ